MLVYAVNLLIVTVFSFLATYFRDAENATNLLGEKKPLIWFCIPVLLSLILVAGLRFKVGTDYTNYAIIYHDANAPNAIGPSGIKGIEIGFIWLCRLCYQFTASPFLMFFVVAAAISILFVLALRDYSKNFWFSCFLFVATGEYTSTFNGIRQALATAIVFFATRYLINRQMWRYFLFVGIASLFHSSALVMIPIYFIVNVRAWSPAMWGVGALTVILLLGYNTVMPLFFTVLSQTRYGAYQTGPQDGVNGLRILVVFAPVALAFLLQKQIRAAGKSTDVIVNLCFLNLLVMLLASKQIYIARLSSYFEIYELLLLPYIFDTARSRYFRVLGTAVVMVCFLANWLVLLPRDSNVLPYQTILSAPSGWNVNNNVSS